MLSGVSKPTKLGLREAKTTSVGNIILRYSRANG